MQSQPHHQQRVEDLVTAIRSLQPHLERMSEAFRQDINSTEGRNFERWSAKDWCRNTFGNALVRLRQLTENNFHFIETMGVLAVARYVFELSVWLNLFKIDSRFGLIYYRELLDTQLRYYQDTAEYLRREAALLKSFEAKESESTDTVLKEVSANESLASEIGNMVKQAMSRVDAEASRKFSLYADDARTNGYGFQAYLVEKKAIPQAERAILDIEKEIEEFESRVPEEVRNLVKGRWQWRQMADKVGLAHEHDYIYSYASKLLHATPASLTTDQKNLELPEICVFLRYIHVKILEIMDVARQQPECQIRMKA